MNDIDVREIWARNKEEKKMTKAELQSILQPRVHKTARGWSIVVWTYLAFVAATLVCEGMYVYTFRSNPLMLGVGIGLVLSTLGFLAYGVHLLSEMTAIERADEDLVRKLRRRIRFYGARCEIWLWMAALSSVFLSFSVSTVVDAVDGTYRINRPGVFVAIVLGQLLFLYGAFKVGQYPFVHESKAILQDLEHQVTTGTERVRDLERQWRRWRVLLVVVFGLLLLWGIWRAIGGVG